MKRKLIKHGASSLTITLPQDWLVRFNLSKGDEVDVVDMDERLILSAKPQKEDLKSIKLSIPTINEFRKRILEIPYLEGVDELEINCKERKTINLIQNEMNRLLGYEIINQVGDKIIIRNIAPGIEPELDILARRIIRILILSTKEAEENLAKGRFEELNELITVETMSQKLIYFLLRNLNITGYKNRKKTYAIYVIFWAIEQVFDYYRDFAKAVIKDKIMLSKEELGIFKEINGYIELFYKMAYDFNEQDFNRFYEIKPRIEKDLIQLCYKTKNPVVLIYLYAVLDSVYHIGIFFSPSSNNFL